MRRNRPLARAAIIAAAASSVASNAAPERQQESETTENPGNTFLMRQRIFAIGDDFWIKNGNGERIFKVDGKAFRVRSTLFFEDNRGQRIYKIQEKMLRVRDTMNITTPDGALVAKVHNALITPLRDRWTIDIAGGEKLIAQGNIIHHNYRIMRSGTPVANVSKQFFRVRDSYGVRVQGGEDAILILAITVVIDMMAHAGR